jgi:1,4-dihydroxy-2-naphthoyl-CoA hydrolase
LPVAIFSCACAGVMRGTTALAASTNCFALLAMSDDNAGDAGSRLVREVRCARAESQITLVRRVNTEGVTSAPPSDLGKGFDSELGLTYIEVTPDGGRAQLKIHDKLLQPWGIVHGGVYCSIIESLASVSGHVWLSENGGGTVVGVNNNTDFLRAISSGTLTAVSTPIHRGRRQQLWLITITDDNDRAVARGQVRLQNLPAE